MPLEKCTSEWTNIQYNCIHLVGSHFMIQANHCGKQCEEEASQSRRSGQQHQTAYQDRDQREELHFVRHQHGQNELLVAMLYLRLMLMHMMLVLLDAMLEVVLQCVFLFVLFLFLLVVLFVTFFVLLVTVFVSVLVAFFVFVSFVFVGVLLFVFLV